MRTEAAAQPTENGSDGRASRLLARALAVFATIKPAEILTAVLMMTTVFLLLTAYYLLKTAREPLILLGGGAEVKSYASAGQAVLMVAVVSAYSRLARHVGRMPLTTAIYLFFASNLVVFVVLGYLHVPVGVPFFLWVGVFSVTVIAQFWSFASDVYTPEQGKRLFAILGIGSSLGAVLGARIAGVAAPLGPYALMIGAAAILVGCLALLYVVHRRELARTVDAAHPEHPDKPFGAANGFALMLRDKYLLLIGVLTLLLNWVNSTGEYILDRTLMSVATADSAARGITPEVFIGQFKAEYFGWVNLLGVGLQLFVVSRVFKYVGVRGALYVLPIVALGAYGVLVATPVLGIIRVVKVAENSVDYSLQNTARQALFLVATREQKYKAKAVIDGFMKLCGDVAAAAVVGLGQWLAFGTKVFALINLGLVGVWLVLVVAIGREHMKRSAAAASAVANDEARGADTVRPAPVVG